MPRLPRLGAALIGAAALAAGGCGGGNKESLREGHPPRAVAVYLDLTAGPGMRTSCKGIGPPSTLDFNVYGHRNDYAWFECRITSVPRQNTYRFYVGQKLDLPDPLVGS